jgi:ribosomal-protein-alanine N-acetyltransferase
MIRKFRRADLETIEKIEDESFPKLPYNRFTFLYYASAYPDNFLVYLEEAKIAGYIIYYPEGHIVSIAVHTAYRRRGIGTRLVDTVLKRTGGYAVVEVRESKEAARKFYTHLGFSMYTVIPAYYGDEDAVVMVRSGTYGHDLKLKNPCRYRS